MFSKCFLDVPNIATLTQDLTNIPGILRAGWVTSQLSHTEFRYSSGQKGPNGRPYKNEF